jgi:hypothetical protein
MDDGYSNGWYVITYPQGVYRMSTVTFDTLKFVEKLKAAGISDAQAKAEAEALQGVLAEALDSRDLKELELTLSVKIAETHTRIAETKADLIRWVVGVGMLQITIITALLLRLTGKS